MRSSLVAQGSLLAFVLVVAACTTETTSNPSPLRQGVSSGGTGGTGAPTSTTGGVDDRAPPGPASTAPPAGTPVGTDTWADGKTISGNITISAGATVTIAPGATINVAASTAITVAGTLKVDSATTHAKLTGTGWTGLVVAQGGTLSATGLDITGASTAIWTQTGNTDATLTSGTITAATPFNMEAGSKLSVTQVNATATGGSTIAGTFVASHLTYDKGTAPGLNLRDAAGTMTISDSILKGTGGGDYVTSGPGKLVKVEYSIIYGSHCALHFQPVDSFAIDHVSFNQADQATDNNTYGAMLYGSTGASSITSSNLDGIFDVQNANGTISIAKSFAATTATFSGTPAATQPAGARIADAQPRAN